jgi:hypothetical protein
MTLRSRDISALFPRENSMQIYLALVWFLSLEVTQAS